MTRPTILGKNQPEVEYTVTTTEVCWEERARESEREREREREKERERERKRERDKQTSLS